MDIRIESLIEGAARASGAVAIIDVFRAFTTAAVAFANGATRITMVASVEEALELRDRGVGQICMGERASISAIHPMSYPRWISAVLPLSTNKPRDAGHHDSRKSRATYVRRFTCHSQCHGTGFALDSKWPDHTRGDGESGRQRSSEDEICALYLRNLLEGRRGNPDAARQMILSGGEVVKFNDVNGPWLIPDDVPFALDIDRYEFAIKVAIEEGYQVARKFEALHSLSGIISGFGMHDPNAGRPKLQVLSEFPLFYAPPIEYGLPTRVAMGRSTDCDLQDTVNGAKIRLLNFFHQTA